MNLASVAPHLPEAGQLVVALLDLHVRLVDVVDQRALAQELGGVAVGPQAPPARLRRRGRQPALRLLLHRAAVGRLRVAAVRRLRTAGGKVQGLRGEITIGYSCKVG